MRLPVQTVEQLEVLLSEPPKAVVQTMGKLKGDILILGVGGKMGPTLARMAKRASELAGVERRVIGVSRFGESAESRRLGGSLAPPDVCQEAQLQRHGVETIRCDLLDPQAIERLPDAPNIIYMAGMKFGSSGNEAATWMMNAVLPAYICRKFWQSRMVAFSTGNVYGLVPVPPKGSVLQLCWDPGLAKLRTDPFAPGSVETDLPNPVGEYAMSCLGRERVFEYFARTMKTPVTIVRLNYACDLRYGVLVDLAQKIFAGVPIDLGMGWFNTIWQGDANAMVLRCFDHAASPAFAINVTGPELLNVREVSQKLAAQMGKEISFAGQESQTALLSNAKCAFGLFGEPMVSADELLDWVADWIVLGGETLNKPTHFEARDGKF